VATQAEAGLSSEAGEIKKQARNVEPLADGENLLAKKAPPASGDVVMVVDSNP
jgi:hypothetical protein